VSQVTDYGASLGRFIAAQSAVSALGDEWDAVEVSVQEIMRTGDFASIQVMDSNGIVKASSDANLVEKKYTPKPGESLGTSKGGVQVRRYVSGDADVLGCVAPITFQGKSVGSVDLGIAEAPLIRVARLSLSLMGVLVLVTVLAVAVAMYFVANRFARPIKLLRKSMSALRKGHYEYRIDEVRKDEYGALFKAFNDMALALQTRYGPHPVAGDASADQPAPTRKSSKSKEPKAGNDSKASAPAKAQNSQPPSPSTLPTAKFGEVESEFAPTQIMRPSEPRQRD